MHLRRADIGRDRIEARRRHEEDGESRDEGQRGRPEDFELEAARVLGKPALRAPPPDRLLDVAERERGGRDHDGGLRDHDAGAAPYVRAGDEQDDRQVPEIDPVAALADPAQRRDAERPADAGSRMGDSSDEHDEAERRRQVAASVEGRVEVLHVPEEKDRADERGDTKQLE